MCILAFSWQPKQQRLHLFANRDEFYARPTASAQWWPDLPHIWAGRDLQAGGTWLGVSKSGRFAALTNVREGSAGSGPRSRGELVSGFLSTSLNSEQYLQQVLAEGEQYAGFNLLLGDMAQGELWYGGNRSGANAQPLTGGIYGLSNATLDTPWPKVERLKQGLAAWLAEHQTPEASFTAQSEVAALALLSDSQLADIEQLPATGVDITLEHLLSAIFIHSPTYGTRAQTLLSIEAAHLHIVEQGRGSQGELLERRQADFYFPSQ